ncbi:MAG TPA: DUF3592 domain-containing protein [Bacillota bacterium]|nr:DUF3592 domain-containing protein [Bacillota bacterium]
MVWPVQDEAESTVLLKSAKKGLYLPALIPRYEVVVVGSDTPTKVSKDMYDSIELGDEISGYISSKGHFETDYHIKIEKMYFIPLMIILDTVWFFVVLEWLQSTKFVKRRKVIKKVINNIFSRATIVLAIILILISVITTILIGTNLYHKFNASHLTEVEATVINKARESNLTVQHMFPTYELLLRYTNEEGEMYVSNKAVTWTTYKAYDNGDKLTMLYRENNHEDTFIKIKSINEIWPAFLNWPLIILAISNVGIFIYIRFWRQDKQKERSIK